MQFRVLFHLNHRYKETIYTIPYNSSFTVSTYSFSAVPPATLPQHSPTNLQTTPVSPYAACELIIPGTDLHLPIAMAQPP